MGWQNGGYHGWPPTSVLDDLYADSNFANGILYGFHVEELGRNLWDFRSYTGTFGDGSL